MKALKTTGKIIGMVGNFVLAGLILVGHFIMNIVGALICAIASQG